MLPLQGGGEENPYTSLAHSSPVIPLFNSEHLCTPAFLFQYSPFSCKSPSFRSQEKFHHKLETDTANIKITQNCCLCCTVAISLETCRLQDIAAVLTWRCQPPEEHLGWKPPEAPNFWSKGNFLLVSSKGWRDEPLLSSGKRLENNKKLAFFLQLASDQNTNITPRTAFYSCFNNRPVVNSQLPATEWNPAGHQS